ncbi:MAG: Na+/H+ antiporter NhaC family protein [Enterocloster sp.]
MTYAVLGYAMIALIVILLLTNKANPIMAFIIVPPIIALTAGYSISEINDFIKAGVSSSMGTALLAMLSIIFFSIMTEQGLFDPVVDFLVSKAGDKVAIIVVILCSGSTFFSFGYGEQPVRCWLQFRLCFPFTKGSELIESICTWSLFGPSVL